MPFVKVNDKKYVMPYRKTKCGMISLFALFDTTIYDGMCT